MCVVVAGGVRCVCSVCVVSVVLLRVVVCAGRGVMWRVVWWAVWSAVCGVLRLVWRVVWRGAV